MSFPSKFERESCWSSRDVYWQCLEQSSPQHSSTSGEDIPKPCQDLRMVFEKSCPGQWVKHFDRKRSYEQFKQKLEKGYDPLREQNDPDSFHNQQKKPSI